MKINVLTACECSGRVRDAFRAVGCNAYSCDLKPDECASTFHFKADCFAVLERFKWDLVIAFPPCTHLCVSGAMYFDAKRKDGRQAEGVDFFMRLASLPSKHPDLRVAIENPVGIMSSLYRQPDQIIHPWQFGETESKTTCLWLHGLPALKSTRVMRPASFYCPACRKVYADLERRGCPACGAFGQARWANQSPSGADRRSPSEHRATDRARTYPGIAAAMAAQWGRRESWPPLVEMGLFDKLED